MRTGQWQALSPLSVGSDREFCLRRIIGSRHNLFLRGSQSLHIDLTPSDNLAALDIPGCKPPRTAYRIFLTARRIELHPPDARKAILDLAEFVAFPKVP